ncbi:MAG: CDP-alcohol phosphatidyltransferase family protein, partial [Verrucomicrobiota bacterium]|nr:CDP-alcohol phosphatidyltransferase family protein [Verrucomicrobiota bacterium]
GGGIGIAAGHFYFYPDLRLNLLGMLLQATANTFDNADGQLARLTRTGSLQGAVVDGFADYLVFLSVYVHLALRHTAFGGASTIWFLIAAAGISHAIQSMVADYYRDGYLFFVARKARSEIDSARDAQAAYVRIRWHDFRKKLAMRVYLNYVRQQEALVPKLRQLRKGFRAGVPEWLNLEYRRTCRPLLAWERLLATNTRMLLLFISLLLRRLNWYLWCEVTLLNFVLLVLMLRHHQIYRRLLAMGQHEAPTLRS